MERSTHGIPEREGYSLKWSIGRVFVQNVPAMAVRYPQDAVWKVAPELELNGKVQAQWEYFKTEQHKRRRAYKKSIL